jgi:hypothetical protein
MIVVTGQLVRKGWVSHMTGGKNCIRYYAPIGIYTRSVSRERALNSDFGFVMSTPKVSNFEQCYCSATYFGGQVFQNGGGIDCSGGSDSSVASCTAFEMTVNSSYWEL